MHLDIQIQIGVKFFRFLPDGNGHSLMMKRFQLSSARSTGAATTGGSYTLDCTYTPVQMDIISMKISSVLPKPSVAEQISRFTGTLKKNGKIVHSFSGHGFSEYSTKTWKKTTVTF